MSMIHSCLAALGAAALLAGMAGPSAAASPDPLARYRWTARILLVTAPDASDGMLQRQQKTYRAMMAGAKDRDLVLVEAVGDSSEAAALRVAYGLPSRKFTAVLIGKDGGEKLRSVKALGPERLFPTIDAMPMRQDEMHRRKS